MSLITEPRHMQRSLIRMALVVAAIAMSACFLACSCRDKKPVGPPEKITFSYANPPYTALADVAQAQGYFLGEGLEVTPHFHAFGRAAFNEVLEGKADFATVAETPVMFAIMKGQKISIIATIQSSKKTIAIVARKDRGVSTPQELRGKKIGVTLGTIREFFADAFLAIHGMARQDVTVVNIEPEEILNALVRGDIDAASTWSSVFGQAQKELGQKSVTFYDQDIYKVTFNIVAKQEFISMNPGKVRKLLRALIRAEEFVKQNPAEAQKIVADFRHMKQNVVGELWPGNTFNITLDQSLLLSLEDESVWAIKGGLTAAKKVPNYIDFIYLDGLASVNPKAVTIVR